MTNTLVKRDAIVYGGSYGQGFPEAFAFVREGGSCALVVELNHVRGMVGAWGLPDIGNPLILGGTYLRIAVQEVGEFYSVAKSYDWSPGDFETIIQRFTGSAGSGDGYIDVFINQPVQDINATDNGDGTYTITSIDCATLSFQANAGLYYDASIEGDMAARTPGITMMVGREAASTAEPQAGFNPVPIYVNVSPYDGSGNRLPGILPYPDGMSVGDADTRIQNATVRMTLSNIQGNMGAWKASSSYDPTDTTRFAVDDAITPKTATFLPGGILAGKFADNNNTTVLNTDPTLGSVGTPLHELWPTATYANRRIIEGLISTHVLDQRYHEANAPSFAGTYQTTLNQYGPALDEFLDNANTPPLYIREGRRLTNPVYFCTGPDSDSIDATQSKSCYKDDSVCAVKYTHDIHFGQLITDPTNPSRFILEGTTPGAQVAPTGWSFPFRSMYSSAVTNLFVTYCVGVSHYVWGSFRILCNPWQAGEFAGCAGGIMQQLGLTRISDLSVSLPRAKMRDTWNAIIDPFWDNSLTVTLGAKLQNKGTTYRCTTPGVTAATGHGPAGAGAAIPDGSVVWRSITT